MKTPFFSGLTALANRPPADQRHVGSAVDGRLHRVVMERRDIHDDVGDKVG
jgi:hypothetical protein